MARQSPDSAIFDSTRLCSADIYSADCPTRLLLDRVGDKWAVLVLGLLMEGPVRFNQLRRTVEGISQKMLSQTLKSLERDGLVTRKAYATVPVTVEYAVTPLGQSLSVPLHALRVWAETFMPDVTAHQKRYDSSAASRSESGR